MGRRREIPPRSNDLSIHRRGAGRPEKLHDCGAAPGVNPFQPMYLICQLPISTDRGWYAPDIPSPADFFRFRRRHVLVRRTEYLNGELSPVEPRGEGPCSDKSLLITEGA